MKIKFQRIKGIIPKIYRNRSWLITIGLVLLLIFFMLEWKRLFYSTTTSFESVLHELYMAKVMDSIRMENLNDKIDYLKLENADLRETIRQDIMRIEKLKITFQMKQEQILQYDASSTGHYFFENTGGSAFSPEIVLREQDTCMITPISNIMAANIKFVQLDQVIQERNHYINISDKYNSQVINYEEMLTLKDSIIQIMKDKNIKYEEAIKYFQKEKDEREKKLKKNKRNTWIVAGAAGGLLIVLSVLN